MELIKNKRLIYFDILKAYAIFLVLYGHVIQHLQCSTRPFDYGNNNEEIVYRIIYSFHMPLFMMISGYFSLSSIKRPLLNSIINRLRMLILPIVTITLLLSILSILVNSGNILNKFTNIFSSSLWFLKSAFICFFITKLCYIFGKYKYTAIIAMLFISQLVYIKGNLCGFIYNIQIMYPCYLIGLYLRYKWNYVEKKFKIICYISFIIFLVSLCFLDNKSSISVFNIFNINLNTVLLDIYVRCYQLLVGISGSVFFISLFYWLFNRNLSSQKYNYICYIGQNTLGIYIFQFIYLELGLNRLINFNNTNFYVFNFIIAPLISIITLQLCISTIQIIKKNKYTKYLFLGEK